MEFLTVVVKVPLKFHLHCSLGIFKSLQEIEPWHERTANGIFFFVIASLCISKIPCFTSLKDDIIYKFQLQLSSFPVYVLAKLHSCVQLIFTTLSEPLLK